MFIKGGLISSNLACVLAFILENSNRVLCLHISEIWTMKAPEGETKPIRFPAGMGIIAAAFAAVNKCVNSSIRTTPACFKAPSRILSSDPNEAAFARLCIYIPFFSFLLLIQ